MRLRYTRQAAAELDEVLTYIGERSEQGAFQVRKRIQGITDLLLRHPYSGSATSRKDLRRIMASPYPYLIFYQVADLEIIIHGVRHAARRPSSMPG